ncbi:hypothetical protein P7C73_g3364, partial [Tremellales sp. Uapishka_1]
MMFSSSQPLGHIGGPQLKIAAMTLHACQMELERQKRSPVIMADAYLECLNKLLEPLAIVQGILGFRTWLAEVQYFMGRMKQRCFSGVPIMSRERQVLQWYSARWRELRGGACDMGRPEAQLVLIALGEMAMF